MLNTFARKYVVAAGLLVAAPAALAQGNPFAAMQQQLNALSARVQQLEAPAPSEKALMWVNHFALLPGDADVVTSFNSTTSGVGTGLTGLVIQSSTPGENSVSGGNKVVHMALQVPPGWLLRGVRVCYQLSDPKSFISQIRLAQVQDPPAFALVHLDDATDLVAPGPVCTDSAMLTGAEIDPAKGSVLISLRVNFSATGVLGGGAHRIVVRALGLHLFRP